MKKIFFFLLLTSVINYASAAKFYELKANDNEAYKSPLWDVFSSMSICSSSVNLLAFEAIYEENKVSVYWSTPYEKDVDYYNLERSDDGKVFQNLTTIKSIGNSPKSIKYSAVDNNPPAKIILYYRLMQANIDGSNKYSETYSARANNYYSQLMITPIISDGNYIETKVKNLKDTVVIVEVSNIFGATYYSQAFGTSPSFTKISFEVPYLKKGDIYFLKVSNGEETITKKFTF
jgi:hypothetical protein